MSKIEVRHIPFLNKWEVVKVSGNCLTLIGRYSKKEEAERVAKENEKQLRNN